MCNTFAVYFQIFATFGYKKVKNSENIFVKIIRDKWELLLRKWLFFAKCFFCW